MNEENKESNGNELKHKQPSEEENNTPTLISTKGEIYTEEGTPPIESLYRKEERGKLIIQPDFQRHFVWNTTRSSRLIESALLGIPLPVIYLAEEENGKEYVIDGQQRLTAFFSFMKGQFRLNGLKVFQELNRKSFKDIDEELQDNINDCKIRTITFKKKTEKDLKFEIFERLNTGATKLYHQELRNCIYRGPYNELLKELSQDRDFMYLQGLKKPHKRMTDVERVLRFAAFYHNSYLNYKRPMRKFLNSEMEKYKNISETDAMELKNAFKNAVSIIKSLLDHHAFKRYRKGKNDENPNGYWDRKFNASLYDIMMYSFAKEDKNKVYRNLDSIREALIDLMTNNEEFIEVIEMTTSEPCAIKKRHDIWRQTLQNIIGTSHKEPRCFPFQLKQELYDNNSICSICGQKILDINDAEVDHIEQYGMGGKTMPQNARLTHRYCNRARSRSERIEENISNIRKPETRATHIKRVRGAIPQKQGAMAKI